VYDLVMVDITDKFKEELQAHGLRVTKPRIAVFSILEKHHDSFLSSEDISDSIQSSQSLNCDRASVYRILTTFVEIGLVQVTQFQGGASKYKIHRHGPQCQEKGCNKTHEHYFKCVKCDAIEPIGECFFEKKVKELEKKGFRTLEHHFEISGYCPNCK
jgi:Fur family ferric uptake transcriptional regulator